MIAACDSGQAPTADLGKISTIKASFGPQFAVTEVAPTGIDPKLLAGQRLPQDSASSRRHARSSPPGS